MINSCLRFVFVLGVLSLLTTTTLLAQCVPNTRVSTTIGEDVVVYTCPGDGRRDLITFQNDMGDSSPYMYIFTNEDNVVLFIRTSASINLENAQEGVYRVWGASYSGTANNGAGFRLGVGQLATDCYALSSNFVEVRRELPEAGKVETESGNHFATLCPDGEQTVVKLVQEVERDVANSYGYIIVDEFERVVGASTSDAIDFEGFDGFEYYVHGIVYRGELAINEGANIYDDYVMNGCYTLSTNNVVVQLSGANGGMISSNLGSNIVACAFEDSQELIHLSVRSASQGMRYVYLVTDAVGTVAQITTDELDANRLGSGVYQIQGLVYSGDLLLRIGDNIFVDEVSKGCFALSANRIQLVRNGLEVGAISTTDGMTQVVNCNYDLMSIMHADDSVGDYLYIVTDNRGVVLQLSDTTDFEIETEEEQVRVYVATYVGELLLQVGDVLGNRPISERCYGLSENFISLQKSSPNGGALALDSGEDRFYGCPSELMVSTVSLSTSGTTSAALYTYLLLDQENNIRQLSTTGTFELTAAETGTFFARGVSHTTPLDINIGDQLNDSDLLSNTCFELSENAIELRWDAPSVGAVRSGADAQVVYSCPSVTSSATNFSVSNVTGDGFQYIITDVDQIVVDYSDGMYDFAAIEEGIYYVYGLSYTGRAFNQTGELVTLVPHASECYALSENFVTVIRETPIETLVATAGFEDTVSLCTNSSTTPSIELINTGTEQTNYSYILTDLNNVVRSISSEPILAVEGTDNRRIWGLAYTGNLLLQAGDILTTTTLSDECATLSDNFIAVEVEAIEGGQIEPIGRTGALTFCLEDGESDYIGFAQIGASNGDYRFVITEEDGTIIRSSTGNLFDFERIGNRTVQVLGVVYTGNWLGIAGMNINEIALSNDCYALSDNAITVSPTQLDGGRIFIDGTNTSNNCANARIEEITIGADNTSNHANYSYILVDENEIVLLVSPSPVLDFRRITASVVDIWGVAHTGDLSIGIGDNFFDSRIADGCFELSENALTIENQVIDGGTISSITGQSTVTLCPSDEVADIISFRTTAVSDQLYQYLITDTRNIILAIAEGSFYDFGRLAIGTYRVWGISSQNTIPVNVGMDVDAIAAVGGTCHGLSDNFLTIKLTTPRTSRVTTDRGRTTVITYVGDQASDFVGFQFQNDPQGQEQFIVTTDQGVIAALTTNSQFDFNLLPIGFYRVYGLAYTGALNMQVGETLDGSNFATGCYNLSRTYVQVICAPGGQGAEQIINTEQTNLRLQVAPNPAIERLFVDYHSNTTETTLFTIYRIDGSIVHRQPYDQQLGHNTIEFDVTKWQKGMYILSIENELEPKFAKFLKE